MKAPVVYFFPKADAIRLDLPGVADRFSGNVSQSAGQVRGPDGSLGVMASPFGGVVVLAGDPDYLWHEWIPGLAWIGVLRGLDPETVRRKSVPRTIRGYGVVLSDGREWTIPVANPMSPRCGLPSTSVPILNPQSQETVWRRRVNADYADLAARATDIAAAMRASVMSGAPEIEVADDDLRALIGLAIGLFYDLTLPEIAVAGLVNPDDCRAAVEVVIDWQAQESELRQILAEVAAGRPPFGASPAAATPSMPPGSQD